MERFDEHILGDSARVTFAVDDLEIEAPESADTAPEESAEEPAVYTDDPVRVYLREMGSVSLLNRQAEVTLARRMERGNLRMQKALSRSPLVRKVVLALYEDIRAGKIEAGDVVNVGGQDEGAKRRARSKGMRRFQDLAEFEQELGTLQQKFATAPSRPSRTRWARKIKRGTVKC